MVTWACSWASEVSCWRPTGTGWASRRDSATWAEVDRDGDPDLWAGATLWRNEGGRFTAVQNMPIGGRGVLGDVDDDGDLDLLVGNFAHSDAAQDRPQFLENQGPDLGWAFANRSDAAETWYDGVDQDCAGGSDYDAEGDGIDGLGGGDCDDTDPAVFPGASERWYDGVDQDCAGDSDFDADVDGYDADEHGGLDCDDNDPGVHPGASEVVANGMDEDCSGADQALASSGSGCAAGGAGGAWWWALGLLGWRRRS
jgi:hypothetical protein